MGFPFENIEACCWLFGLILALSDTVSIVVG